MYCYAWIHSRPCGHAVMQSCSSCNTGCGANTCSFVPLLQANTKVHLMAIFETSLKRRSFHWRASQWSSLPCLVRRSNQRGGSLAQRAQDIRQTAHSSPFTLISIQQPKSTRNSAQAPLLSAQHPQRAGALIKHSLSEIGRSRARFVIHARASGFGLTL